jgi:hypothetical protein
VEESRAGIVASGVDEAASTLGRLVQDREELASLRDAAERFRHRSLEEMALDYHRLYDEVLPKGEPTRRGTADDARLLIDLRIAAGASGPPIHERPRERASWLAHPLVRRFAKRAIPSGVRKLLRPAALALAGSAAAPPAPRSVVRSFHLQTASTKSSLRPRRRLAGAKRYEAIGDDPNLLLTLDGPPFAGARVSAIELDLLSRASGPRSAQLFWIHEEGEHFSEEKSFLVPLTCDGRWRTYTIEIPRTGKADAWGAGEHLRALRFDPLDGPGVVALGTLRFLA